jgi:hypothetical protein
MRGLNTLIVTAALALLAAGADAAWALRCLEEAVDPAEIAATRALIDAACPCFGPGTRKDYKACAFGVISDQVATDQLRRECKTTVKKIYTRSVCGHDPASKGPLAPCVRSSNGKVACSLKTPAGAYPFRFRSSYVSGISPVSMRRTRTWTSAWQLPVTTVAAPSPRTRWSTTEMERSPIAEPA